MRTKGEEGYIEFGLKPFEEDDRDILYRLYRTAKIPALPTLDQNHPYGHGNLIKNYGMYLNDQLGICVVAGEIHTKNLDNVAAGHPLTITNQNAITVYEDACDYNPNDPNTDQGCEVRTVLGYTRNTGIPDGNNKRHTIDNYVKLDHTMIQEIYEAVYFFGKAKIGMHIPQFLMDQFDSGKPWTISSKNTNLIGDHDVEIVQVIMDNTGKVWLMVVTWGVLWKMELPVFMKYCTEAWTSISKEMLNAKGISVDGWAWDALSADIAAVTNNPNPEPEPAPVTPTDIPGAILDLDKAITILKPSTSSLVKQARPLLADARKKLSG